MWGQDYSSSVLNNTHDGVPEEASGERVHARSGLILTSSRKNEHISPHRNQHPCGGGVTTLNLSSAECLPHQQHQNRATNHGDGCGQLPSIASTVGPSTPICILRKTQLLDGPLCNLEEHPWYHTAANSERIILYNSWMSKYTTWCTINILHGT